MHVMHALCVAAFEKGHMSVQAVSSAMLHGPSPPPSTPAAAPGERSQQRQRYHHHEPTLTGLVL